MIRILLEGIVERGDDIGPVAQDMDEARVPEYASRISPMKNMCSGVFSSQPAMPRIEASVVNSASKARQASARVPMSAEIVAALEGIVLGDEGESLRQASLIQPQAIERAQGPHAMHVAEKMRLLERVETHLRGEDRL